MDLDGPSMEPPEGVLPNFDNPPNANGVALAVLILYLTLSSFSAFLYGYVAIFHVKKFHISDSKSQLLECLLIRLHTGYSDIMIVLALAAFVCWPSLLIQLESPLY